MHIISCNMSHTDRYRSTAPPHAHHQLQHVPHRQIQVHCITTCTPSAATCPTQTDTSPLHHHMHTISCNMSHTDRYRSTASPHAHHQLQHVPHRQIQVHSITTCTPSAATCPTQTDTGSLHHHMLIISCNMSHTDTCRSTASPHAHHQHPLHHHMHTISYNMSHTDRYRSTASPHAHHQLQHVPHRQIQVHCITTCTPSAATCPTQTDTGPLHHHMLIISCNISHTDRYRSTTSPHAHHQLQHVPHRHMQVHCITTCTPSASTASPHAHHHCNMSHTDTTINSHSLRTINTHSLRTINTHSLRTIKTQF